jgi:hypothetical protein
MQKLATINLIYLFNLPDPPKYKTEFDNLKIIQLRNKAASHSSNFKNDKKNTEYKFSVYEIYRAKLEIDCICLRLNQDQFEEYDLMAGLIEFDNYLTQLLYLINQKLVKNTFNNQGKFMEELILLKREIDGDHIIKIQDGNKIILTKENKSPRRKQR